jgi:hypothetical protein
MFPFPRFKICSMPDIRVCYSQIITDYLIYDCVCLIDENMRHCVVYDII